MKIADNNGVWLINNAQFAMHDSQSNTRFEPQEPTKATLTQFVLDQPTIVRCADPTTDLTEKQQTKLDEQIAKDEAERLAREDAAQQAMLAANAVTAGETAAPPANGAPAAPVALNLEGDTSGGAGTAPAGDTAAAAAAAAKK